MTDGYGPLLNQASYLSESPAPEYSRRVRQAKTWEELAAYLAECGVAVSDASRVVDRERVNQQSWAAWQRFLSLSGRGRHLSKEGERLADRFSAILLPIVLLKVEMLAVQYHVPWGTCVIQARKSGVLDQWINEAKGNTPAERVTKEEG